MASCDRCVWELCLINRVLRNSECSYLELLTSDFINVDNTSQRSLIMFMRERGEGGGELGRENERGRTRRERVLFVDLEKSRTGSKSVMPNELENVGAI